MKNYLNWLAEKKARIAMTIEELIETLNCVQDKSKKVCFENPDSGHILVAEIRPDSFQEKTFILF